MSPPDVSLQQGRPRPPRAPPCRVRCPCSSRLGRDHDSLLGESSGMQIEQQASACVRAARRAQAPHLAKDRGGRRARRQRASFGARLTRGLSGLAGTATSWRDAGVRSSRPEAGSGVSAMAFGSPRPQHFSRSAYLFSLPPDVLTPFGSGERLSHPGKTSCHGRRAAVLPARLRGASGPARRQRSNVDVLLAGVWEAQRASGNHAATETAAAREFAYPSVVSERDRHVVRIERDLVSRAPLGQLHAWVGENGGLPRAPTRVTSVAGA